MGEIADAMVNGEMCEMCGVYLDYGEEPMGIPMYCSSTCAADRGLPKKLRKSRILPEATD